MNTSDFMLPVVVVLSLLWTGTFGYKEIANDSHSIVKRATYADGGYGCSRKFFKPHCWRYCSGNSGKWCYTVYTINWGRGSCRSDGDCSSSSECQGWCAWNSDYGCTAACPQKPRPQQTSGSPPYFPSGCRKWWECQSRDDYNYRSAGNSQISGSGIWISPDAESNLTARGFKGSGNTISAPEGKSTPHTVLWFPMSEIQKTRTELYWDIQITAETQGISIGVSDLIQAKPGSASRGLYYGGGLSDGSELLVGAYGPTPKGGDKVGLLVKLVDANMNIYFFLNDKPLGLAFDLPQNVLEGVFPVVKFFGKGSVRIEERDTSQIPTIIEPLKVTGIEGNWTLETFGKKEQMALPVTMKISKVNLYSGIAYRLRLHILSRFMGQLSQTGPNSWKAEIYDKPTVSGRPEEMKFELGVLDHFKRVTNVNVDAGRSELELTSGDGAGKSIWKQLESKQRVVKTNPFKE